MTRQPLRIKRVNPASAGLPLRKPVALDLSRLFSLFLAAKHQPNQELPNWK